MRKNLGSFVVNARPGFNISGKHKFNLITDGHTVWPEYCKTCSAARRFLRIDGENVDYVQRALNMQPKWWLQGFDKQRAINAFSARLIIEYRNLLRKNQR